MIPLSTSVDNIQCLNLWTDAVFINYILSEAINGNSCNRKDIFNTMVHFSIVFYLRCSTSFIALAKLCCWPILAYDFPEGGMGGVGMGYRVQGVEGGRWKVLI